MVVVKTSKAELHDRLPTQLDTLLSCAPYVAIFSDHAGRIGNHTVHDALSEISSYTKADHVEFKGYEQQKQDDIKLDSASKYLDKWKFLPMVYRAYKLRPSARFYVVIESDTTLSWTNLLQWISRLDSRIPYYAGAPLQLGNTKFVQSGPGILLSNAALRQFVKAYDENYDSEWEARVGREGLGDVILATAMQQANVELSGAHPILQANTPLSLRWERKYWCTPAVSWAHQSQADIKAAWGFQKSWADDYGWEEPYMHRDAFVDLVAPHLVDHKDEWDNGSEGTLIAKELLDKLSEKVEEGEQWYEHEEDIRQAVGSWKNCQKVCEMAKDCHQWKYSKKDKGECHLGKNIKIGASAPKKAGESVWTSGWIVERIRNSTREWECHKPTWRFNQ